MGNTLRGRPKLNISLNHILETVRRRGQVVAAGRELGCSPAYIHAKLQATGLSLRDVLEADSVQTLLNVRQ